MKSFTEKVQSWVGGDQSLLSYALMLVVISIIVIMAVTLVAPHMQTSFQTLNSNM